MFYMYVYMCKYMWIYVYIHPYIIHTQTKVYNLKCCLGPVLLNGPSFSPSKQSISAVDVGTTPSSMGSHFARMYQGNSLVYFWSDQLPVTHESVSVVPRRNPVLKGSVTASCLPNKACTSWHLYFSKSSDSMFSFHLLECVTDACQCLLYLPLFLVCICKLNANRSYY